MADRDSLARAQSLSADILAYVDRVHAGHDAGLEHAFTTSSRHDIPDIHLSAQEGKLLEFLIRLSGAMKVIEVGTLAGYSALWMARGLAPGGRLWTIESDVARADIARGNIAAAGMADRIEVVAGDAHEILPKLEREAPFDAIFLDADKESYRDYEAWAAVHLRPGGLLIGDNAFVFGELLKEGRGTAMREFHEKAARDFDTLCLTTPEGMLIGLKR